jgi:uncharacterized membrane protein YphA (DoxX/SURF4 family)
MDIATASATAASPSSVRRAATRYLPGTARVLLGSLFFVGGLNGFLNFIPPPSMPMPEAAVSFGMALMKTGYMFPLIKGTEVACGALLLFNRYVPLALAVLAPIVINIFAFHAFLTPGDIGMAASVVLLEVYLAWSYRTAFAPLLARRTTPASR